MSHFDSDDEKENAQALLQSKEYQQLVKDTYKHFNLECHKKLPISDYCNSQIKPSNLLKFHIKSRF